MRKFQHAGSVRPAAKSLRLENLETRLLMASDWQNAANPQDVDSSGLVSPTDVLLIFNKLNNGQRGELPSRAAHSSEPLCDVNGDGLLTPVDALLVVNVLNRYSSSLVVAGGLAPESDPNGNGVVLSSDVIFVGQTAADVQVQIFSAGSSSSPLASTRSDAQGLFRVPVTLPERTNWLSIQAVDPLGKVAQYEALVQQGDVVLDWNAISLNVVREWTAPADDSDSIRSAGAQPPVVARNFAMIHIAMYDAINAIEKTHQSYLESLPDVPEGASTVAAAAAAAHQVASQLYGSPDELVIWQATLDEALNTVAEGSAKAQSIAFGRLIGNAVLAARVDDGASSSVGYTPGSSAGDWNSTAPDFLPPLLPQWPSVRPFALTTSHQFLPAAPPELSSPAYAAAVDEVMRLGRFESAARTSEQTEIALFWADGRGTFTPPGHWNQIAADVSLSQGKSTADNARLFALLNIALADAGIAAWDAKYEYDLWRPIDAIRKADSDGNGSTLADPSWTPLLNTPPFPTYTSGHSTFSGAASAVLNAVLGSDVSFTTRADAGHQAPGQSPVDSPNIQSRDFAGFDQAAEEAGLSRIYGGIHFSFDNTAGLESGRLVGQYVVSHFLQA